MPWPLKSNLTLPDILTEALILLTISAVFLVAVRLYRAYNRPRLWLIPLAGAGLYSLGAALDFLDEFVRLPQVLPRLVENSLIAAGCLLLTAGALLIGRQLLAAVRVDLLTGLYNRRYFEERLRQEAAAFEREGNVFSFLLLDLAGFKAVNARLGYAGGDATLRRVAAELKSQTRPTDVVARWGGDEFAILLPQQDRAGAVALARRLAQGVAGLELPGICLRLSAGVVMYPVDGEDIDRLLALADQRASADKRTGADQAGCAGETP